MFTVPVLALASLHAFTSQSLFLLIARTPRVKFYPLLYLLIPVVSVVGHCMRHTMVLQDAVRQYLPLALALAVGNLFGWFAGYVFRRIVDAERAACMETTDSQDDENDAM